MVTNKRKHILVAPLDWGLGHTARCMPFIGYLLSLGHNVTVAANSQQRTFIEETFSGIDIIHLEGYDITYSKWNKWAQSGLLFQLPHINKRIKEEHNWLEQLSCQRKIDGIISDNRYGLFHKTIPSVILTHQLLVQTGLGRLADLAIQKIHYKLLNYFSKTWIVDIPGSPNLAGALSHPSIKPKFYEYIGLLSRFTDFDELKNTIKVEASEGPLVILLSGPEPQRTELSKLLWRQSSDSKRSIIFIEGKESAIPPENIPEHITWYNRLTQKQLGPILTSSGMVICRSGYSTIMDLLALGKKAILIPTTGQTEQLYLANKFYKEGVFYSSSQQGFNIRKALKEAEKFPYRSIQINTSFSIYKDIIWKWSESL